MTRLTIGLPVYNGENYLQAALDSILGQTYTDFELIISDNGSTDSTPDICRAAANDPRVRYVRHDENRGAGWNYEHVRALAADTELYKWAAHDDVMAPTFLERCVAALDADPAASLAFTGVAAIDSAGTVTKLKRNQVEALGTDPGSRFKQVLASNANPEAVFGVMRTSALAHTRGQGDYISSDRVLLAELALVGHFVEVPEVLFFNRDHPTRSVRITGGDLRKLTAWFAPEKPEQFLPAWRLWREYLNAARRAPLSRDEKLRCYAQLPWFLVRHSGKLAGDLRFAAVRSTRPWRQRSNLSAPVGA
jgi:glycosyltransferase involved in cell wall biosynthesis